ncbi:DUF4383 domain-containing protein [Mangrovihabitans endophyticus]|uniref:DUF4383 domain-containing protein n=1 Tax=Mangrovihabitans endophyticus TaxID=1751298 RepID=A0A8J3FMK1_9ACTN|nr:DUF4383 domain-containing protein [Mangrovihabitans endophyticus]GGK83855.1 hypothetical protein GCM10012284_17490 [Mangrovihabitans endophyticus]
MAHNPLNHPLRPLYRALGGLVGIYLVVFGVVGLAMTAGDGLFGQPDERVLGQGANLLWSLVSVIAGVAVLAGAVIGRNLDIEIYKYVGWGMLVVGSYALASLRTDANFLAFTMATVVVAYVLGMALITAGLYCKVGPAEHGGAPRQVREGRPA